ncbi:MAG: Ppx/GppA family phosphatase [Verrucomicrobiae bacterium]|nr:Ppx/GppA family phosphatase [Verrucomicrobiae bacterium]MDW7978954.1 Ppx/GppA phosphatase family protein [Verrucomicrobiales bacterium]
MVTVRRAIIDVGTNSIKLLIADVTGQQVEPVYEDGRQTRLGQGIYEAGHLKPQAIAQTAVAVGAFVQMALRHNAASIKIIATSAAREAPNADELKTAIEEAVCLPVEVVPGEREALLAYRGVRTDPVFAEGPMLILDVGGGSTEVIVGNGPQPQWQRSYQLGAVRLAHQLQHSDPPTPAELANCRQWLQEFIQREMQAELKQAIAQTQKSKTQPGSSGPGATDALQLVGTGGTSTVLACIHAGVPRFDRAKIDRLRLRLDQLRAMVERLWQMPLESRKRVVGLPPDRADIILFGAAIYEALLDKLGFSELVVSTRGLRFGAVVEA